jgi:PilZ domain
MDSAVLLQDLPKKSAHQILRSVTWTEVGSSLRATTALRVSISRAATLGRRFLGLAALFRRYSPRAYQRTDSSMMTDQLTGNGHRWGQRIAVDIPVQVAANDSPAIHGLLKNLSLSGALMEADHELRLHAYIAVTINLPEADRGAKRIMARVARKFKDAVGLEWCEFAPNTVKDLLRSPSIRLPV